MEKIKALVISTNEHLNNNISSLLNSLDIKVDIVQEWKRSFTDKITYSFYIVDEETIGDLHQLSVPSSAFLIGITTNPSFDTSRKWMRIGASDVIVYPDEMERLGKLFSEMTEKVKTNHFNLADEGTGKVYAFYSAKGGSGKSTLAVMAAQSLNVHGEKRVIIIDLNAQFGGLEALLNIENKRSYIDLQPVIEELTINHIENVAVKDSRTNTTILLGPANPIIAENITEELISKIIRTCRLHYDYIILDLPNSLTGTSFTGLNEATKVFYILTPDAISLRAYRVAGEVFERFQIRNKVNIILNRAHSKSELSQNDIEKLLDCEISGVVRSDYFAIQPFVNMGEPFYLQKKKKPTTKVARDIRGFVETVMMGR